MKRPELLIAIYQDSDQEQFISEWLPGRITYISKDNLYVKIEDYSIGNNKRTQYIQVDNEIDDDEFIYLDEGMDT